MSTPWSYVTAEYYIKAQRLWGAQASLSEDKRMWHNFWVLYLVFKPSWKLGMTEEGSSHRIPGSYWHCSHPHAHRRMEKPWKNHPFFIPGTRASYPPNPRSPPTSPLAWPLLFTKPIVSPLWISLSFSQFSQILSPSQKGYFCGMQKSIWRAHIWFCPRIQLYNTEVSWIVRITSCKI